MFTVSKSIKQGVVVALRGKKFILCGKGMKSFGVWENGHDRVTITLEGERIITSQPRGVVRRGQIGVKVGE